MIIHHCHLHPGHHRHPHPRRRHPLRRHRLRPLPLPLRRPLFPRRRAHRAAPLASQTARTAARDTAPVGRCWTAVATPSFSLLGAWRTALTRLTWRHCREGRLQIRHREAVAAVAWGSTHQIRRMEVEAAAPAVAWAPIRRIRRMEAVAAAAAVPLHRRPLFPRRRAHRAAPLASQTVRTAAQDTAPVGRCWTAVATPSFSLLGAWRTALTPLTWRHCKERLRRLRRPRWMHRHRQMPRRRRIHRHRQRRW